MLPASKLTMVSWQADGGRVYHYYGDPAECRPFHEALEAAKCLVAHAGKFEAHWLRRLGYDILRWDWFDTFLAEWVILGNNHKRRPLALDETAQRYGFTGKDRYVDLAFEAGIAPEDIDSRRLITRCRRDVRVTSGIMQKQRMILAERGLEKVFRIRCLTMPVLAYIEAQPGGIYLDKARVYAEYEKHVARQRELDLAWAQLTGGINAQSRPQLAQFLYGGAVVPCKAGEPGAVEYTITTERKGVRKTTTYWATQSKSPSLRMPELTRGSGKHKEPRRKAASKQFPFGLPMTDSASMAKVAEKAKTNKQLDFFKLQEEMASISAALSKNLEFFKGVVDERDGLFFAEIRQGTTQTHRLSGRGLPQQFLQFETEKSVQSQNMPRAFKKLQTRRHPNYLCVEADAVQLEFRVAAGLTDDPVALADIKNPNFDAHIQTAAVMHEKEYDHLFAAYKAGAEKAAAIITRHGLGTSYNEIVDWRQDAKPDTYKPLYGGERGTEIQERYYTWFRQHYAVMNEKMLHWLDEVEATGKLRLPTGLTFYWDAISKPRGDSFILVDRMSKRPIKPSVFNYPVQNVATGEIVPYAVSRLVRSVVKAKLRVIFTNTVHDSVSAEVHKDDVEAYSKLVMKAFTHDCFHLLRNVFGLKDWKVPLGCEIKVGEYLGEGKGMKIDVDPTEAK